MNILQCEKKKERDFLIKYEECTGMIIAILEGFERVIEREEAQNPCLFIRTIAT
jgi:hypothetical protein